MAGDPFEPELAAVAADMSEAEAMDAVDELLQLDLARDTDVPDASDSVTRSSGARCTRPRPAAGG